MTASRVPYTNRTDWLEKRRQGIGASDIAAVMGLSPWSTPLQVWVSKTVDDVPEVEQSEDMKWGLRMESAILDEFEQRHGQPATDRGTLWRNTDRPWMLATPDGMTYTNTDDGWLAVVDAKKTDSWSWDDGIPQQYLIQVQWQMAVTGAPQAYLVALHRGRRLEIYPITADPELQQELIEAGEHFWTYVESETPPAAVADDNAYMASLYPTAEERPVEISPEIVSELRQAKDTMKTAKARVDAAEVALKEAMADADTAVVGQEVVATWKNQTRRSIDQKRLRVENPDIAAEYSVERSSRVLRVK